MATNTLNDIEATDAKNAGIIKDFTIQPGPINSNEYDHVISFFKRVMKDEIAAEKFTQSLYQVANTTEIPVLDLLATFKGQDLLTLTASMAYYLNGIRSPSTLVGVQNVVRPNYYAARNVLS